MGSALFHVSLRDFGSIMRRFAAGYGRFSRQNHLLPSSFLFDRDLDFRDVILWIAAENHPRSFYVDFARWQRYFVAVFVDVFEQFGIRAFQIVIWPVVPECDAMDG